MKKKKKILIVDDEKNTFMLLKKLLEQEFFIDYAHNGKEGLQLFMKNQYDIIITDNNMPVMSGMELIREIKKINTDLPIVLITGDRFIIPEFDDVQILYKPFNMNTLKDLIIYILHSP